MRPRVLLALAVGCAAVLLGGPAAAQTPLLPNLQPLPPVNPYLTVDALGQVQLRFGTLSWNSGAGPVEIRGGAISEDGHEQEVWQRVYLSGGGYYDRLAGSFMYHSAHGHIHFEGYADYTLEAVDTPTQPPGVSMKTSFCLLDIEKINTRLKGAPKKAVYTTCNATRQGISVGWGDLYGPTLPGQSIAVTGFPAGTYRLSFVLDPLDQLLEIDDDDNTASVLLFLDPATLTLQVLGEEDPGALVEVYSMEPATIAKGETIDVAITGAGFDASLPVSFTGSGPAPKIRNLVYESGTTIRATLTAGKGGPGQIRSFDLHVGPSVLEGALTVLP